MKFSVSAVMAWNACGSLIVRGGENEKEKTGSMVIAFNCLSLRRMRNDSRHGRRYTEHRESREKGSFRIGAGPECRRWSAVVLETNPVNPQTPFLMKPEHNQSCGLPFAGTRKNSSRSLVPKTFPRMGCIGSALPACSRHWTVRKIESASAGEFCTNPECAKF